MSNVSGYGGQGYTYASSEGPGSVSCSGSITAHFKWNGGSNNQSPPSSVIVVENCTVSYALEYPQDGSGNCTTSFGANNEASTPSSGGEEIVGSRYTPISNPGTSFSVTASPIASASASVPNSDCAVSAALAYNAQIDSAPDFAVDGASASLPAGSTAGTSAEIVPINGFNGTVTLSFTGAPSGVTVTPSSYWMGSTSASYAVGGGTPTNVFLLVKAYHYATPGNYSIGITGTGTVNGQTVTRNATLLVSVTPAVSSTMPNPPPYGGNTPPQDTDGDDPINLATGVDTYHQRPDLTVYNPTGIAASFERTYYSNLALTGYGSPGLSSGWTHGYDITVQGPAMAGTWGALTLDYANGAQETLTPVLSNGSPTGAFTAPSGAPYIVSGAPSSTAGQWQSITVTWDDQTQWKFTPSSSGVYVLGQVGNRTGQSVTLSWNSARDLTSVADTASGTTLLTLAYDGNGRLSKVTDPYNRQTTYSFGTDSGTGINVLQSVSQIAASGATGTPARVSYGYVSGHGLPLLATVTVPSPTGSGTSTDTVAYNSSDQVASYTDANGNAHAYSYGGGSTQVQVSHGSTVALAWTENFDSQDRDTGSTDAAGYTSHTVYGDTNNPYKPTQITDKNGHSVTLTYDGYGHLLTTTDSRGVQTTDTWSYSAFTLGRLMSVQVGTNQTQPRTATTFTYDEPYGLVHTITGPAPGSQPGGATVSASFTYDAFGDVLTATGPGNNTASTITTTYNYTSDPGNSTYGIAAYSQAAAVHEPLTATDNLGNVTHLRYNARGLASSVIDALGDETDCTYTLADQPATVLLPATGQSGSGRGERTWTYQYVGGPLMAEAVLDESGNVVRQVTYTRGPESEVLEVSGSTEPVFHTYDALYRLSALTDGGGHTTHYFYNATGYLYQTAYPLSGATTAPLAAGSPDTVTATGFDGDGDVTASVDGNDVTTTYTYNDPSSLLTDIHYTLPSNPPSYITPLADTQLSYDLYGRVLGMTDASGSHGYVYDDANDLLSATTTYTGLPSEAVSYAYYSNGSRQTMSTPAGSFSYTYDADGRLTGLTNPFGEQTAWGYSSNNWLADQNDVWTLVTFYTYDAKGEVTNAYTRNGAPAMLANFTVPSSGGYDGAGDRLADTEDVPAAYNLNRTFGYDGRSQLTQEDSGYNWNGGYDYTFQYDNATSGTSTGPGNMTSIAVAFPSEPSQNTSVSKSFNADNQWTNTNGSPAFSYDGNGNTTSYGSVPVSFDPQNRMTGYGSALTAGYNGDGLRAWKQNSSGRTYFLYDGEEPVCELNSSGSVTATNTFGANGLVSRHTSSSVFYVFDLRGCVCLRANSSGSVLSTHYMDANGSGPDEVSSDPWSGPWSQWGGYTDMETGWTLCSHRYYVGQGRFLTRDPTGYQGGINLYAYCQNNPTGHADPTGFGDGVDSNTPGMSSGHPGMQGGTPQSNAANGMLNGLLGTLANAGAAAATGGLGLIGDALGGAEVGGGAAEEGAGATGDETGAGADAGGETTAGDGAGNCGNPGGGGGCFVAGTPVQMADGTTEPIEQVRRGQWVMSRNSKTGRTEARRVLGTLAHPFPKLVTLTLWDKSSGQAERIVCTPEHPFRVAGRGFVRADALGIGTSIVTRAGPPLVVRAVKEQHRTAEVYNLTVAVDHTFFVGGAEGGAWVHNDTSCTPGGDAGDGGGDTDDGLPPETIVVRGGECGAEGFANGSGVWMDGNGNLQGISVGAGNTLEEASTGIKNGLVGVTDAGTIQDAGGTVVPTPTANNPFHGTLGGLPPGILQEIFQGTLMSNR